jgi:cytochrome c553
MEHKDLLEKSMNLLEEAMNNAFKNPSRTNPEKIEQIDVAGNKIEEEMSDDEIDSIMNTAAEKKFGKGSAQAKAHKQLGKKTETPAQKKARKDAEAVAKSDSES